MAEITHSKTCLLPETTHIVVYLFWITRLKSNPTNWKSLNGPSSLDTGDSPVLTARDYWMSGDGYWQANYISSWFVVRGCIVDCCTKTWWQVLGIFSWRVQWVSFGHVPISSWFIWRCGCGAHHWSSCPDSSKGTIIKCGTSQFEAVFSGHALAHAHVDLSPQSLWFSVTNSETILPDNHEICPEWVDDHPLTTTVNHQHSWHCLLYPRYLPAMITNHRELLWLAMNQHKNHYNLVTPLLVQ